MSITANSNPLAAPSAELFKRFTAEGTLPGAKQVPVEAGFGFEMTDIAPSFTNLAFKIADNPTYNQTPGTGRIDMTGHQFTAALVNLDPDSQEGKLSADLSSGQPDPLHIVGTVAKDGTTSRVELATSGGLDGPGVEAYQLSPSETRVMTITPTGNTYLARLGHLDKATNAMSEQTLTLQGDPSTWNIATGAPSAGSTFGSVAFNQAPPSPADIAKGGYGAFNAWCDQHVAQPTYTEVDADQIALAYAKIKSAANDAAAAKAPLTPAGRQVLSGASQAISDWQTQHWQTALLLEGGGTQYGHNIPRGHAELADAMGQAIEQSSNTPTGAPPALKASDLAFKHTHPSTDPKVQAAEDKEAALLEKAILASSLTGESSATVLLNYIQNVASRFPSCSGAAAE